MDDEDQGNEATPGPNPRREEPHESIVIDGTASEVPAAAENETPAAAATETPAARRGGLVFPILVVVALAASLAAMIGAGALWLQRPQAPGPQQTSALADLTAQVAALQKSAADARGLQARVATLEAQTAALRAAVAPTQKTPAAAPAGRTAAQPAAIDPAAFATLAGQVRTQSQTLATLTAHSDDAGHGLADLTTKLAALADRVAQLEALSKAPKIDVAALQATARNAADEAQAAALVVVARSLTAAVNDGKPFARETDAARNLGADPQLLQPLLAADATGVATAADLAQSFARLAGPILAGVDDAKGSSVLSRLASEAGALISVRTVGETAGTSPAAVIARIETALAQDDVARALTERETLPPTDRQATAAWAARAGQRLTAQKAAQAIADDATTRLGKAPS